MKKTLIAACAVAALAASLPMEAQAQWRRGGGAGVAAGIIAGTMLGAAAASAAAPRYYYDAPPYIVEEPRRCWWERQWVENDYGDMVRRRVRVCDR